MKITVWVVSVVLAVAFLLLGGVKLIMTTAELEEMGGVPVVLLRIAGAAEVLGALGLILPAATRIVPVLTPLAASGLVVVMTGATVTNIIIGMYAVTIQTVLLGMLAAFVAWARYTDYAIQPRGLTDRDR